MLVIYGTKVQSMGEEELKFQPIWRGVNVDDPDYELPTRKRKREEAQPQKCIMN